VGNETRQPRPYHRFRKRSDLVAEEITAWIVSRDLRPGDRLPPEKSLIETFSVSRGTMREALRALEVQGLVRLMTGPRGGGLIVEIPEERAMQFLCGYFYFRTLTIKDIYQVRCIVEPELAVAAVGHLTEAHFSRLAELIDEAAILPRTPEQRRTQRRAELEFHDVIADACPNSWLAFVCRFMNRMLNDLIVFRKLYYTPHKEFAEANRCSHLDLIAAFRRQDRKAVSTIMKKHMEEAAKFMTALASTIDRGSLLRVLERRPGDPSATGRPPQANRESPP
jgi:DNA-binding FadR family transcriptional regulator